MSWLFGKKKKKEEEKPKINVADVKEKLDKQIDFTSMNINKYEKQIEDVKSQAKAALQKKDKKKAIMLMKKKKIELALYFIFIIRCMTLKSRSLMV